MTMKTRRTATLTLTALTLTAVPLLLAGPASAGADKIDICHATGNGWVQQSPNNRAFVQGHADHTGDIYEGFQYRSQDGGMHVVPASNWDTEVSPGVSGKEVWANGCTIPTRTVTLAEPTLQDATCIDKDGHLLIPQQEAGVIWDTIFPKFNPTTNEWYIVFQTAPNHEFPDGTTEQTRTYPITVPDDAECVLPAMGAGNMGYLAGGAGVLALGAGLYAVSRRKGERA